MLPFTAPDFPRSASWHERVPGYPWLPLAFMATSAYRVYASVAFVRVGTIFGIAVLLAGLVPLAAVERRARRRRR